MKAKAITNNSRSDNNNIGTTVEATTITVEAARATVEPATKLAADTKEQ